LEFEFSAAIDCDMISKRRWSICTFRMMRKIKVIVIKIAIIRYYMNRVKIVDAHKLW